MNPFDRHGIDHLSVCQLNLWAAAPAIWVMERLLGRRAPVGAAAHRGTAVEAGSSPASVASASTQRSISPTPSTPS